MVPVVMSQQAVEVSQDPQGPYRHRIELELVENRASSTGIKGDARVLVAVVARVTGDIPISSISRFW
jgi:hypothetical protein